MYIAMNRFNVTPENAEAFEALWLGRDSHLMGSMASSSFTC